LQNFNGELISYFWPFMPGCTVWLPGFSGTGGVNETQAKPGKWHQRQAQLDY